MRKLYIQLFKEKLRGFYKRLSISDLTSEQVIRQNNKYHFISLLVRMGCGAFLIGILSVGGKGVSNLSVLYTLLFIGIMCILFVPVKTLFWGNVFISKKDKAMYTLKSFLSLLENKIEIYDRGSVSLYAHNLYLNKYLTNLINSLSESRIKKIKEKINKEGVSGESVWLTIFWMDSFYVIERDEILLVFSHHKKNKVNSTEFYKALELNTSDIKEIPSTIESNATVDKWVESCKEQECYSFAYMVIYVFNALAISLTAQYLKIIHKKWGCSNFYPNEQEFIDLIYNLKCSNKPENTQIKDEVSYLKNQLLMLKEIATLSNSTESLISIENSLLMLDKTKNVQPNNDSILLQVKELEFYIKEKYAPFISSLK